MGFNLCKGCVAVDNTRVCDRESICTWWCRDDGACSVYIHGCVFGYMGGRVG